MTQLQKMSLHETIGRTFIRREYLQHVDCEELCNYYTVL